MTQKSADSDGRDGLRKETFRDGKLSDVGKYLGGDKTGVWKYYDKHGKLRRAETY